VFWRALAVSIVVLGATASAAGAARTTNFDSDWRFALVNREAATDPTGAYARAADPGYDDSSWRALDLPHDWSIELLPTSTGNTTAGTGFLQGGLGWYRKTFTLPRSVRGKRISVEFDGVYMDSEVYFNGRKVASHPYGYTGFAVDLTGSAEADGRTPNVLAVKVRNQVPSSRWYSGSGIYRHVHLVVSNPVHVARHGVFVTTPDLERAYERGRARVHVKTDLTGGAARVLSTLRDPRGRAVGSARSRRGSSVESDIRVAHPRLWSTEHPNLYTLETRVIRRGRVLDRVSTTFGMRWFAFSPDAGFSLNGRRMSSTASTCITTRAPSARRRTTAPRSGRCGS
jgi:beta-galactosidase